MRSVSAVSSVWRVGRPGPPTSPAFAVISLIFPIMVIDITTVFMLIPPYSQSHADPSASMIFHASHPKRVTSVRGSMRYPS